MSYCVILSLKSQALMVDKNAKLCYMHRLKGNKWHEWPVISSFHKMFQFLSFESVQSKQSRLRKSLKTYFWSQRSSLRIVFFFFYLFVLCCFFVGFWWIQFCQKFAKIFSIKLPSTKFLNKSRSKLAFISMLSFKKSFLQKFF